MATFQSEIFSEAVDMQTLITLVQHCIEIAKDVQDEAVRASGHAFFMAETRLMNVSLDISDCQFEIKDQLRHIDNAYEAASKQGVRIKIMHLAQANEELMERQRALQVDHDNCEELWDRFALAMKQCEGHWEEG